MSGSDGKQTQHVLTAFIFYSDNQGYLFSKTLNSNNFNNKNLLILCQKTQALLYLYESVSHLDQLVHYLLRMWLCSPSLTSLETSHLAAGLLCVCVYVMMIPKLKLFEL